ncbi:FAD-dependent oxidoreductase [Neobacillus drentensis]|uniref:flavin monoamine oxidase family protein n=1 Tax=Neobacillus drentensis TaxID=220684 RepID=UPI002FFD68C3
MTRTRLASILQKCFAIASNVLMNQTSSGQAFLQAVDPEKNRITEEEEMDQLINISRNKENPDRIVIVGAGLAGLTCAYRLKQAGISSTIYEATGRVGGRCWTRRGFFKEEQIVEGGGEFIDTNHKEIVELVKELGLKLDHLPMAESEGTAPVYFFNGGPYSQQDVTNDFLKILPNLKRDLKEAGEMTLYHSYTERGYELDHMSVTDYINEIVPGGIDSNFGKLLEVAYTIENGADANQQSALNLLYLLGFAKSDRFQIYGDSDECFHIRGGNDQLPMLLAEKLNGQIRFHSQLVKIEQNTQSGVRLHFREADKEFEVLADKVILAIPFRILKMIDYESARFSSLKKTAIKELGMGVNTKLHVQFSNRFWKELGNNGETFSDTGYQQTFESSRAQPGRSGILVNFTGAETAEGQMASTEEELKERTKDFLDKLKFVLPDGEKNWNGLSTVDHWLSNQWSKGAYSYWKVGQFTKFAGIPGEREGNIFFAGEHTSINYPGYLNGAVETGERAANEVINDLLK